MTPRVYTTGNRHPSWKGEQASYVSKHIWVGKHFNHQQNCELCRKTKGRQWANINHLYKRIRSDWKWLCIPCHREIDEKSYRLKKRNNTSSIYNGVRFSKVKKKWEAYISNLNGHFKFLGYFTDEKIAAKIADDACFKYFGYSYGNIK